QQITLLIRILRLAILLNRQRNQALVPDTTLTIEQEDNWGLKGSNSDWLAQNQLLEYELKEEQQRWQNAGWSLKIE
ncbi:exopolyphosphatase, partial [Vibrio sp. 10N.237.312.C02]